MSRSWLFRNCEEYRGEAERCVGGGLKGRGEVEVTMTGGEDWRDKFLDIFALEGLDVSDTLLDGEALFVGGGDIVLTVNLCKVSIRQSACQYKDSSMAKYFYLLHYVSFLGRSPSGNYTLATPFQTALISEVMRLQLAE